jgi:hypothetical protein
MDGRRCSQRRTLGFAGFIAMLVGAVIRPRGLVWIIALGLCVVGAVAWLLSAIDLPAEDIRWANAAAFAVAASLVLGLRWMSPRRRVEHPDSDVPGSELEPSGSDN